MNPYRDPRVRSYVTSFFRSFYSDTEPRTFVFGINPGRFGGGRTGVMFTDPVALEISCGIANDLEKRRESHSEFFCAAHTATGFLIEELKEMTPEEFEQARTTARIIAIESVLAVLLTALTRSSPTARESLLTSLNHLVTTSDSIRFPDGSPEYTDVIAGETQDAITTLVAFLKDHLKNH